MNTPTFSPLFATRPAVSPAIHDLADFNAAPADQLTTLLTFMTACRELARTLVVGRPYLRPDDVYTAASRTLHTLPDPLVTGIVNAHCPVDRVPLVVDAVGTGALTGQQTGELRDAALAYAAVQGHLFIADPAVWGSAEAVAMLPLTDPAAAPPITTVFDRLVADVDARTILPRPTAWQLTVSYLEESNRLKLETLLGTDRSSDQ